MPRWEPIKEKHYVIEDCRNAAAFLKGKTTHKPKLAIVYGHGMDDFEACVEEPDRITFEEMHAAIPLFPTCSMPPGKNGCFIFGIVDGVTVLVMHGRFHLYEGHSAQATTFPIRIMNEVSSGGLERQALLAAYGYLISIAYALLYFQCMSICI